MDNQCRHTRVQIVSRDEDAEYVECLECREIFESSEFRDMDIESKIPSRRRISATSNGVLRPNVALVCLRALNEVVSQRRPTIPNQQIRRRETRDRRQQRSWQRCR